MADPLSISASALAVVTVAIQSTKSLYETVKRFKDRSTTLRRLQDVLGDLATVLNSLTEAINAETSASTLLQGPVERCSQVCREFEQSMKVFSGKSKTGFRDWAKMEFMRGDINEFIDTIEGYKSTISVGLGTITLRTSKVSHHLLQEYNEMIQTTAYNLEVHLQRIDDKLGRFTTEDTSPSDISLELKDERAVTEQCLLICEDARSYIKSLKQRKLPLLGEDPRDVTDSDKVDTFEAQILTRHALDENRNSLAETIGRLRERLESLVLSQDPRDDNARLQLQKDIDISKQCLEVCKVASEASRQKIYRVGEVIAEGDSDQVVVTTLADLFDVKKALSRNNSAQLIGSMTEKTLQYITDKRYNSRFGAVVSNSTRAKVGTSPSASEAQKSKHSFPPQRGTDEQSPGLEARRDRPSPNQMRKRQMDSDNVPKFE